MLQNRLLAITVLSLLTSACSSIVDDSHSSEDIADLDMVKLLNNGPMMKKLSQISA